MKKTKEKQKIRLSISDCERDFIQFMFCENRVLLGYKYKELYKAMFKIYKDIWKIGKDNRLDLGMVNEIFKGKLWKNKRKQLKK